MRTFLIHDPLRVDRERLYINELVVQRITGVEMVPAVKTDQNVRKNISEAHKGCIRRAVEEDLEMVMILEDDVKFSAPGAYQEFLRLIPELPDDWDLFTGGSYDYTVAHKGNTGNHMYEPVTKVSRFSGLHCYVVHKRFYQGFLETNGVNNLDKNIRGQLWMSWPMQAIQHDGFSDNRRVVTNYNQIFAKKIKLWKGENID